MANKQPTPEQLAKFKEKFINDGGTEEGFYKKGVELGWIDRDEEYEKTVPTLNYDPENKDTNEQVYRDIKYNSSMSPQEKNNALLQLEEKSKSSINKRNENLPDDINEITYISGKNKENSDMAKKSRSSLYDQNARVTYHAMTPDKDKRFMDEIKKIYANSDLTDEQKRKKITYIVDKLTSSNRYVETAYGKYKASDDKKLSKDELAEKQMLLQYQKNFNNFKAKADKYIEALGGRKSQNWYNLGRDLFGSDDIDKDLHSLSQ